MKKLALLFCLFLVFVACGKDKTIEKIIYGDNTTYDDERPAILDKTDFDKVPVSKSFDSTDDFFNYLRQCFDNKTNLLGKKFKIKGTFDFSNKLFVALNEKHYFYYSTTIYDNASDSRMIISFADSDINNQPPEQLELEITCIIYSCLYNAYASIKSYSYDLRN